MVTFVAIIALLFFAVAMIGVIAVGLLTVTWGPAAFAAFACFVTLHRAGADGLITLALTLLAFVVVRVLTGQLIRAGLSVIGLRAHTS